MVRSLLAITIHSLLVCSVIFVPAKGFADGGNPAPADVRGEHVLITKEWKISPDLIPRAKESADAVNGAGAVDATKKTPIADRESAKNWLIANGVVFNGAASAIYIIRSSRLIVRNTQDQLDLVDTIISSSLPKVEPVQIEIECKLVEVEPENLKELSFDSLSGRFISPATQNPVTGGSNVGTMPARVIEQLIFPAVGTSSLDSTTGAISGVFTDPQFQLLMRAIKDKKGIEILSVPRVTVKSGQLAVIEFFREFCLPTEGTPPQIPRDLAAATELPSTPKGTVSTDASAASPISPASSAEYNLGITLDVKPVIGPDGYTIDLNLAPQVTESDSFVGSGSPFLSTVTNPITGVSRRAIITPKVGNPPVFSTRKVTNSVSVFDGATVVLGDLAKGENVRSIISDEPAGPDRDRHFRRNFLFFVSVNLINPASGPVRDDEKEEVVETVAPPKTPPVELPLMPK